MNKVLSYNESIFFDHKKYVVLLVVDYIVWGASHLNY